MPIPPDIDPFRALALCFGVTLPSDMKRDRDAALERLGLRFAVPPGLVVGVAGERLVDHLERDMAVRHLVVGGVDRPQSM